MFDHRVVHKCKWYQKTLGIRSIINNLAAQVVTETKMQFGESMKKDFQLALRRFS